MAQWLREFSVGDWYVAGGQRFEIVSVDVNAEVVLVQSYDGALDEIDFDSWCNLNASICAAPEDLSGALDASREDFGLIDDQPGPEEQTQAEQWLDARGL